jgi:hypothetical protein
MMPFGQFDSLGAVAGLGDNQQFRAAFQHPPQRVPKHLVVVNQQNGDWHGKRLSAGHYDI